MLPGFIGFLPSFTGFYWVVPSFTGFYIVKPSFVQEFTEFYLVSFGFT